MNKRILTTAIAATAALSLTVPAQASVTIQNFTVAGDIGSGTFSLAFDDLTSTYSLSALNFTVVGASTTFDTSNSGVAVIAPNVLVVGGTVYGVAISSVKLPIPSMTLPSNLIRLSFLSPVN